MISVDDILQENERRYAALMASYDPISGEGALGERKALSLSDYDIPVQHLPVEMFGEKVVKRLAKAGSIQSFIDKWMPQAEKQDVVELLVRLRCAYDFQFWAYMFVRIKAKNPEPGTDGFIPFMLNRPQCILIGTFEAMRLAGEPIRVILLKARQWGGSTATQMYIAWIQLVLQKGLNSIIVSHVKTSSNEVNAMFRNMLDRYPVDMLYNMGETYSVNAKKLSFENGDTNLAKIDARNCKIKIGTAEKPDGARGGDSALVHCSEVGLWRLTLGKKPEDIVDAACEGVALMPNTMIIYESTAKGTGNFFHHEWVDAKAGISAFKPVFIAWYDIPNYQMEVPDIRAFAASLIEKKDEIEAPNPRADAGRYTWWQWQQGATLQGLYWYSKKRAGKRNHAGMASEYPTDDIEAFQHSGRMVFDRYAVEDLRAACKPPSFVGELHANASNGRDALNGLHFVEGEQGRLRVWDKPDIWQDERVLHRYIVSVDIGGKSDSADYSVISVIDRYWMAEGGKQEVVAQWRGHCRHSELAWKAAQIASWYDNALLVIESNTLETKDKERDVDGDQSGYILNQIKDCYDNLYAREQSETEIAEHAPVKYGFHTNTATKPALISHLDDLVSEGLYIERDEQMLHELLCYERKPNGSFGAILGEHDDILMSRGIGLYISSCEMPLPVIVKRYKPKERKGKPAVSTASTF